jgi:hypothetical protein
MSGIGNVQLGVNLTGSDVHNIRLTRTATGMSSATGGFVWNPTTRHILKREETDKQNDDNLTFLFEYRALLNSRVQTLITQLSNALASDLDVAMNATNAAWLNDRPAMNGNSGNTIQDAGAGRTAYNYMMGWFTDATGTTPTTGNVGPAVGYNMNFSGAIGSLNARGTGTIVTAEGGKPVDTLTISNLYSSNPFFQYVNVDAEKDPTPLDNRLNDGFNGPLGAAAANARAKNLFEKVLFDAISSVEYKPVLSSGLFKNLVVAASSSLPTGSQLQASFNLNFQGTQDGGRLIINMDKMTAFYHS